MVELSTLNVYIKIKHHFLKINLQSPTCTVITESFQLITFAKSGALIHSLKPLQ